MAKAISQHRPDWQFLRKIGIKIRQLREQRNMSIEVLAGLSGLSYKYLQEVETAKYSFTVSVLYSITQALRIPLTDFFRELDAAPRNSPVRFAPPLRYLFALNKRRNNRQVSAH